MLFLAELLPTASMSLSIFFGAYEGNNTFKKEEIALSSFVSRGCDTNTRALRVISFYSWKNLSLELAHLFVEGPLSSGWLWVVDFFIVWLDDTVGVVDHMVSHKITF